MDSETTYMLIPLPKIRNTKLWWYFGYRSDDGTLITKSHESIKVRCASRHGRPPTPDGHGGWRCRWSSGGRHRELQGTLRQPGVRRNCCDTELKLMVFGGGWHGGTLSRPSILGISGGK